MIHRADHVQGIRLHNWDTAMKKGLSIPVLKELAF
jgi:hypothetical protein